MHSSDTSPDPEPEPHLESPGKRSAESSLRRSDFLKYVAAIGGASLLGGVEAGAAGVVRRRVMPASKRIGAAQTLKIGVEGPLTGPDARTGDEFKSAVPMAFETAKYQVGPYKLELVWINDESDPAKGVAAYEQAVVGQGIQAALLNWNSSVSVAVMDVAARHKIPHIFALGAAETINDKWHSDPEKYGYWMAKGWPVPAKLTDSYVKALQYWMTRKAWTPPKKEVALWGENTDWGRGEAAGFKPQFQAAGFKVVSEDFFPIDQTDFNSLLTRYKNDGVPVLAGTCTATAAMSGLVKQWTQLGLNKSSLLIADGLGWVGEWYKLTGSASNNVIDQIPEFATARSRAFATAFQKRYKFTPSPSAAGLCYDYARFFIRVLQTAYADHKELTNASIYETAKNKLWSGKLRFTDGIIMTNYQYSPKTIPDPIVGKGYFVFPVLQYHNGKPTTIYPPVFATGKLTKPVA
jgi:branched-chain amino acid transport system substrate-binding protein